MANEFFPPVAQPPPITLTWGGFDPNQGGGSGSNSGNTNSDQLVVGSVAFLDEETPDDLTFKLNQILAVHVLIGGSKTIQALGSNMEPITIKGDLFAGNVQYRIGQLYTMEVAAQPVALTYLTYSYQVMVSNVTWKFLHRWRAQYEFTVTILKDTSGTYTTSAPPGVGQQVNATTAAAQATITQIIANDAIGFAAAQAACNTAFLAIELAGVISQLSGSALQALVQIVETAIVAVEVYQAGLP